VKHVDFLPNRLNDFFNKSLDSVHWVS